MVLDIEAHLQYLSILAVLNRHDKALKTSIEKQVDFRSKMSFIMIFKTF